MKRICTFLIAMALMAGMVGCGEVIDNGDGNGNGNGAVSYELTVSSTSGGSVVEPGEGVHIYEEGTVVDLVAVPDEGHRFASWTGDVDTVADVDAASTTITMNGNYSITANFVAVYSLTIASTTGGSVTTPGEGSFSYDTGTVVNLVATPANDYRFINWTGDVGTVANVNAASTTITMNGDYSITANFEEECVVFADPNLEAAIRTAIGKPTGCIYPADLEGLTYLDASDSNITDLTGLEYCTSLVTLGLADNQIVDLSPLANLANLGTLWLWSNQISDISPLANLTNLWFLNLLRNDIGDISPLANLTNMYLLYLCENHIGDLSPLANLTNLQELSFRYNGITDISPLLQNEGLGSGDVVMLGWNPLSEDSINIYIPELKARGVTVTH